jgi:hypothetical protein
VGPDPGAPQEDLKLWEGPPPYGGYVRTAGGITTNPSLILASLHNIAQHNGGTFGLPALGAETHIGFQAEAGGSGPLKHVRVAGGAWTTAATYSLVEIALAQGKNATVVRKKLERIGKIAVPAFGL